MGYTTYTCACGDTYKADYVSAQHNYSSVVTAPTATAQGYTTHTCSVCGDSYVDSFTDKLPATEENAVAKIGDTFYATLADALAAAQSGETIVLVADTTYEGTILLNKGITLDLNGKTLTADYLVAFNGNSIIDTDTKSNGLLKVAKGQISLSKDNKHIAVFAGEGYRFAEVGYDQNVTLQYVYDEEGFIVKYRPKFNGKYTVAQNLINGILSDKDNVAASDVQFIVRLSWIENDMEQTQDFVFSAERIETVFASSSKVLKLTVNGVSAYSDLKATVIIKSNAGVESHITAGVFNPSPAQE